MKRILLATALGLSLFAAPALAAYEGYITDDVTLRAGPDEGYPVVGVLYAGTGVGIYGCVDGWSWCDVDTPDGRGWVRGDFLQEEYQGRRVWIYDYGPRIGIPFITFEFGSYWNSHYRDRSWYRDRDRYVSVRPHFESIQVRTDSHSGGPSRTQTRTYDARTYDQSRTRVVNDPRATSYQNQQRTDQQRTTDQTRTSRQTTDKARTDRNHDKNTDKDNQKDQKDQ
jgi:uncharacterized protein YraI